MMADQEFKQQFRDALRQALLEADIKEWKEWLDQETKEREESMSETKTTLEQPFRHFIAYAPRGDLAAAEQRISALTLAVRMALDCLGAIGHPSSLSLCGQLRQLLEEPTNTARLKREQGNDMSEETKTTLEQPEWRPLTSAELAQAEEEWGPEMKAEAERESHE